MTPAAETPRAIELNTPVQFLKGCGPQRAELLARLGVYAVRDLVFFFPRDYQDLTDLRTVDELEEGPLVSVLGIVDEVELADRGPGRSVLGVLIKQDKDWLRAIWFNQPFMRDKFQRGQTVLLSGRAKQRGLRWEMSHPRVQFLQLEAETDEASETPKDAVPPQDLKRLLPLYPLTEGLQQHHVRRLVQNALEAGLDLLDEVFSPAYLEEHRLLPLRTALPSLHFPASREDLERARRRFVYQELLVLQLALALRRHQVHDTWKAFPLELTARIDARIRRLFPFELTEGQNQAVAEIAADMGRSHPMNRLLEGDVGSGKTIVAAYAILLAVAHGTQVVLMAPTEVLARQHSETFGRMLAASHTRLGLLTGALAGKARATLLDEIASGQTQIVIGTSAVVNADVKFARLGLAVIDEQHKFGVRQRAALRHTDMDPHYLVMTATPIPRTLGMTLFGDLDITTLRDRPPGRQTVHSYLPSLDQRAKWWDFFRKKLREGRQGYVIVPLVEGSESVQAANLNETYEALANGELEAFRIGLVHGRMTPAEKQAAMDDFRDGKVQVLVATSVVEVGVDVPNATLMTVEGAERFGLAQLHQLRGRVSRGSFPGFCTLFADPQTPEAVERLEALVASNDGFHLAEVDFALRGPGDLLGTRQHGLPPLRIADLVRDAATLDEARRDARALIESDPGLTLPEHERLRRMALTRYGKSLELGDVG
jgi:ATP-dependent DNA helicase RecG